MQEPLPEHPWMCFQQVPPLPIVGPGIFKLLSDPRHAVILWSLILTQKCLARVSCSPRCSDTESSKESTKELLQHSPSANKSSLLIVAFSIGSSDFTCFPCEFLQLPGPQCCDHFPVWDLWAGACFPKASLEISTAGTFLLLHPSVGRKNLYYGAIHGKDEMNSSWSYREIALANLTCGISPGNTSMSTGCWTRLTESQSSGSA